MGKVIGTVGVIVGAVALAATGIGAIAAPGLAGAISIGGIKASTLLLAGTALQTAGRALTKQPKASTSTTDRLNASMVTDTPRKMAFGRTALNTDLRYQEWWGREQEYCSQVFAVASHHCEAIEEVWLDDKLAWTAAGGVQGEFVGYLVVAHHAQAGPGSVYRMGWSNRWGASATFSGCATLYLQFKVTGNGKKGKSPFTTTITSRVTVVGKGARVPDPRFDSTAGGSGALRVADQTTWAWAPQGHEAGRNPALALLFYLIGWRIQNPATGEWKLAVGRGVPVDRIDLGSFITAANLCDEPVMRANGQTEPRYRCDGTFSESDDPAQVIAAFETCMNAKLRDSSGRFALQVLHNDLATPVVDFTDDDVLGDFTWTAGNDLNDRRNIVRGRYTNPSALYQLADFPQVRLAPVDGIDRIDSVDFALVQSGSQGQRLAKQRLQRQQYQGAFGAEFNARGWAVKDGDIVRLTFSALGFDKKLFRVSEGMIDPSGVVPLVLVEEHQSIYAWDREEAPAVQAAVPNTFNPLLLPIIVAIDEAGTTAEWTAITGLGKPEDNATVGAPTGTKVGDTPVEDLEKFVTDTGAEIDRLRDTYGSTESAAASAAAASTFSDAAKLAKEAAEDAQGASQTAATASATAKANAEKASGDATKASDAAAKSVSDAAAQATLADGARSAAAGYADRAGASADTATGGAATATEQAGIATAAKGEAEQAATASAGSARNASSSADAAGQSATAASADRVKAEQAQGKAEAAQSSAATSESNAAGSASSAAINATVSATAARDAAGAAMMLGRSPGASPSTWSYNAWEVFAPAAGNALKILIDSTGADLVNGQLRAYGGFHVHPTQPSQMAPARRYRVRMRGRMLAAQSGTDGGHTIYLMTWDRDGNPIQNYLVGGGETLKFTVAQGEFVIESGLYALPSVAGAAPLHAHTAFARAMYRSPGSGTVEIREIYLVDVEAEEAANASAAAAAKSASTAAASEDSAGKSASAASLSATNASTSEGKAGTSASNAAKSESNASGSASTATTQAGVSATSARDAAGTLANDNGSPGAAPTQWTFDRYSTLFPSRTVTVESLPIVAGRLRLPGTFHVHAFAARAMQAKRRYVVTGTIRCITNDGNQPNVGGNHFYLAAWNAQGGYEQYTLLNLGALGSDHGDVSFTSPTIGLPGSGADIIVGDTVAWGRPFYRSPGGANVFELVSLRMVDVESEAAALGSATAAAGSASAALASEGAAGKSASAASTSETNARTSAGAASTSAGQASKSEETAAGSASSAVLNAGVSATAARDAAGTVANDGGAPGQAPSQWSTNQYALFQPDRRNTIEGFPFVNGRVRLQFALHVHPLGNRAIVAKRRYRVVGTIRCVANDGQQQAAGGNTFYLTAWDAAGNYLQYLVGDIGPIGGDRGDVEFTSRTLGLPGSGAEITLDPTAAWGRPMYRSPGGANVFELVSLRLVDVEAETAAAGSASAASQSASTAAASQTEAGKSATAASTSETNAKTSAGEAKASESSAASSKDSASGSAVAAATSATVSAKLAASAAGVVANEGAAPGQSPTEWTVNQFTTFQPNRASTIEGYPIVNGRPRFNAALHLHPLNNRQLLANRRYRVVGRIRCITNDGNQPNVGGNQFYLTAWDAGGGYSQYFLGDLGGIGSDRGDVEFTSRTFGLPGSGAEIPIDGAVAWARPMYRTPGGANVFEVASLRIVDVESETAASGSANAAAGSASQAGVSQTEAGKSATAASKAQTAAEAAQGKSESAAGTADARASAASGSAASALASSIVSAQVGATLSNIGATFTDWPDTRGIPAPWMSWGNGANNRLAGIAGRYGFQQVVAAGAAETGLYVSRSDDVGLRGLGAGKFIVVADVTLDSGSLHGSGVLFRGMNDGGQVLADHMCSFSQLPSQSTNGAATGAGSAGRRYQFSRIVEMPAGVTQVMIYLMSAWTAFANPVPAKTITWHKCGIRPASEAEIASDKVAGLEAKTEENRGAIAVAAGRVASAWAETTTSVPGAEAAIRMLAMLENGRATSNIALIATQIALLNMVDGKVIPALKAEGGNIVIANDLRGGSGRIIFDNGSVMKVSGTGFGSNNQFIEWFGPRKANLAECTEANATQYLKTDGSSYFGGSLRAGVIKNAVQTTSLATDANVGTGTVGSNGGQRVVVVNYSWSLNQSVDRPQGNGSGGGLSATVILSRNGIDVMTLNVTGGVWTRSAGAGADEPGSYNEQMGGSITFTDNSGGDSVAYAVRLTSRTLGPGPENGSSRAPLRSQGIGIIQTEG
ncbi:hypothetical protein ACLN6N_06225 [Sphingomonas carotinifaciens]|uniref:hypothetical protein n=1 Tax=Sphingomonas carotinifaciens TaxID=1166323 RepID=UPI0039A22884